MSGYRTTADLQKALEQHGVNVSEHQLRRWATDGLLPQRAKRVFKGHGMGSESEWPADALDAAMLLGKGSRPGRAISMETLTHLLGAGYCLPVARLREVLEHELGTLYEAYGLRSSGGGYTSQWSDTVLQEVQEERADLFRDEAKVIRPNPGTRLHAGHLRLYLQQGQRRIERIIVSLFRADRQISPLAEGLSGEFESWPSFILAAIRSLALQVADRDLAMSIRHSMAPSDRGAVRPGPKSGSVEEAVR